MVTTGYRAAVLADERAVRLEEFTLPVVEDGEVLLQVEAANVCQTDVKKWRDPALPDRLAGLPLILGHEVAGTVLATGQNGDPRIVVGDRVAVDPVIRQGRRYFRSAYGREPAEGLLLGIGAAAGDPVANARLFQAHGIGGAFGRVLKIPEDCAIKLPPEVTTEAGSLLEPVADIVRSVRSVGEVAGKSCAVFGLGPMGLLHAMMLDDWGARVVGLDPRADRRDTARLVGVTEFALPADGVDVAFLAVGGVALSGAIDEALRSLRRGGAIVLFSSGPSDMKLVASVNQLHYGELRVIGVVGSMREDFEAALDAIGRGVIDVAALRHPRVPFAAVQTAFELMGKPGVQKVGLNFLDGER